MKQRAVALMHQRNALVVQIGAERDAIAQQGVALRPATQMIDKITAGMRFIKNHPGVLLLPIALLALLRPRRLLSYAASGMGLWRPVQRGRHRLRQ